MKTNEDGAAGEQPDADLDQGLLPGLLSRQLRMTHLAVFRTIEQLLATLGITPQQFALLVIVDRNPGSRQSLLAKARGLDKSTLVPMIDRLERDGLLERRSMATDRRIKTIWITDRGSEVIATAMPLVQQNDAALSRHLTAAERRDLMRLLQKLRTGVGEA